MSRNLTVAHPSWCAVGYRCTVDRGVGGHRSRPITIPTPDTRVGAVVTLVRDIGNPVTVVEVRLSIRTPGGRSERQGATDALSAVARMVGSLVRELS